MEQKAIADIINEAIGDDNDRLPKGFSLLDAVNGKSEGMRFADGAEDGIWLYHTVHQEPDIETKYAIADALSAASVKDFKQADSLFEKLGKDHRAIALSSAVHDILLQNKDTLDNSAIYDYAVHMMLQSPDVESVKFGLIMIELFDYSDNENLKHLIRLLGLADEFTLFVVYNMKGSWEDDNEEVFELAKRVRGWGRVHAVEHLDPDTDEIREWLLTEGVHNDVIPAYSALLCWEGAQVAKRLQGPLNRREFEGVRDIIAGLLDEGPCEGISAAEDIDAGVREFLTKARSFRLGPDDYDVINSLKDYYQGKGRPGEFIVRLADELIKEM